MQKKRPQNYGWKTPDTLTESQNFQNFGSIHPDLPRWILACVYQLNYGQCPSYSMANLQSIVLPWISLCLNLQVYPASISSTFP